MGQVKQYSREYKEEAIKPAEEKGCKKASEELGISYYMLMLKEMMFAIIPTKGVKGMFGTNRSKCH